MLTRETLGQKVQQVTIVPSAGPLAKWGRERLPVFVHRGKANARTLKLAQVVLKVGASWSADESTAACDVSANTVGNVRGRYLTGGLNAVLHGRRQQRQAVLAGQQEAHLIAGACSRGPRPWTLRGPGSRILGAAS